MQRDFRAKSNHTRLAQCPTKIPPRCAAPFTKGGFEVPSFDKGGTGRISQQVSQCTNVMWFDLVLCPCEVDEQAKEVSFPRKWESKSQHGRERRQEKETERGDRDPSYSPLCLNCKNLNFMRQ